MKILYVNPDGDLGGGQRSLLDVVAGVRAADPSLEALIVAGTGGPFLDAAEQVGARVEVLAMPRALAAFGDSEARFRNRAASIVSMGLRAGPAAAAGEIYARRLRRIVLREAPDLVHSNGNKCHLLASRAAPRGLPVLWHIRDFLGARAVIARALRVAVPRAAAAIAISEAVGEDARRVLPGFPVEVIANAIDTDLFAPGPADGAILDGLAGLAPAPAGVVRVGMVAAYARWKGQDLFLRAAASLRSRTGGAPVRFYVIGGPIYRTPGSQFSREELERLARDLDLGGSVGFVPFQTDVAGIYRALDVAVHASVEPEPFGRTIVEAMACGRAVVAAAAGGAREIVTDGVDAAAFSPGDAAALAAAIAALVEDPGRRRRMGEAARRTAVDRFSRPRLGREVAALYRRLAGGREKTRVR